jgi:hypothetical protein
VSYTSDMLSRIDADMAAKDTIIKDLADEIMNLQGSAALIRDQVGSALDVLAKHHGDIATRRGCLDLEGVKEALARNGHD